MDDGTEWPSTFGVVVVTVKNVGQTKTDEFLRLDIVRIQVFYVSIVQTTKGKAGSSERKSMMWFEIGRAHV